MCIKRANLVRQRGVTMVELIMFIVIVGVAVTGVLRVFDVTTRSAADPVMRKQALAIAEGLLEEVQLAHFTFCDPTDPNAETANSAADCAAATVEKVGNEAGGQGRPFDNVNDYVTAFNVSQDSFNNTDGLLVDAAGQTIGVVFNSSGVVTNRLYAAQLAISPVAISSSGMQSIASSATPADISALQLTVTVRYNNGQDSVVLDGYRTRYAPQAVP